MHAHIVAARHRRLRRTFDRRHASADDSRLRIASADGHPAWAFPEPRPRSPRSIHADNGRRSTLRGRRVRRAQSAPSANVLGSGTVGPDPITDRSSPTTSEIASVTIDALRRGSQAAALDARRGAFRTVLSSSIVAPPQQQRPHGFLLVCKRLPARRAAPSGPRRRRITAQRADRPSARCLPSPRARRAAANAASSRDGMAPIMPFRVRQARSAGRDRPDPQC